MTKYGPQKILMMAAEAVPSAKTGGLADTILDSDPRTGFAFTECNRWKLFSGLVWAIEACKHRDIWHQIQVQSMRAGSSWNRSARRPVELYQRALASRTPRPGLEAYQVHS